MFKNTTADGLAVVQKIQIAYTKWTTTLELHPEIQLSDNGHDVTSITENQNKIEVHIFCDVAVTNVANKQGIGCIAFDRECGISVEISEHKNGNSPLPAKI